MPAPIKIKKPKDLKINSRELGAIIYYLETGHVATKDEADELQKQVEKALKNVN